MSIWFGGELGNNYGWYLGVLVGWIKVLFYLGNGEGLFRVEIIDDYDDFFMNESVGFDVEM